MLGLREVFTYFQCSQCQCLQIETIPANLARFYPTEYNGFEAPRSHIFQGIKGAFRKNRYQAALFPDGLISGLMNSLFPAGQYQHLGKLGLTRSTRIIDIGCGRGSYLYPLYELGMKNVQGADPFIPATITYPNGYRVQKSFVYEVGGEWDIILYNHSFEHVPDPLENLQAVYRLLAPNGTCLIRIPTVSSYAWEHYRTDWFQLDAPRHLFLHSVQSMKLLAEQASLTLTAVEYDSDHAQFIHSEKYRNNIAMYEDASALYGSTLKRKLTKLNYAKQARTLNQTNQGDQAIFYLKKVQGV
ncbi:class I SAM-dependent methyltransferase [Nibrella saemangeumensis]|uniref:Class I SAM-dependent methyltransferase n=2 Tax=Nibrella saemangeumensis TaxID=1084526 RepID=A0ABP8MSH2_9BACT